MAYVKYILKKLIQIVVITFLVSLLVFFSLRLNPTSPLTVIIGNKQSTPELQQQYTEQFDLDEPLLILFGSKALHMVILELITFKSSRYSTR